MNECLTCALNARGDDLPPQERIFLDEHWRIARRHVAALDELPSEAAVELGRIIHAASAGLREVVGCERTYVVLFAEAERHRHVHVHVVPRMPWFEHEDEGPRVFRYMNVPEGERVAPEEQQRIGAAIASSLQAQLSSARK